MFWRFGFHNASTIDSLLDKEDVVLEAILDEDDLIQECKAQNTRLIDYFGRVDVLHKLLGYVTGQIESDEKGKFKYPYIATEVLCCEIWSIVDTCVNERQQLLVPFWETVLEKSPDEMKSQMIIASHFAKINSVFMAKKPAEMLEFIQAQPSIVDRLLRHVESPAFIDLIGRILQLDENVQNCNVIEWLASQNFMGRLVILLSPNYSPSIHNIVSDLLKTIISLATPSPGAGITDTLQNGPASNLLVRELASKKRAATLVDYMLFDFSSDACNTPTSSERKEHSFQTDEQKLGQETEDCALPCPTYDSSISSIVQSMGLLVEVIRKNNSDYFEPYLFHTLRNRLIQVQQHSHLSGDDVREALEGVMRDMVDRMGVVHLGPMLQILAERLGEFQKYLRLPRSLQGPIKTTIGPMTPFTLERYRIVEVYAELLHCSNMSLLNRPANYSRMYDSEGRLQGGLGGLEELAHVIALNGSYRSGGEGGGDGVGMDERDEIEPALDFPIHSAGAGGDEMLGSDDDDEGMTDSEDEPGSSDDEAMEEIVMSDEPPIDVRLSPLPVHDDGLLSISSESGMGLLGNMASASFSSVADVRDLDTRTVQLTRNGSGSNLPRSSPDHYPPTPPPGLTSYPSSSSSSSSFRRNPQGSRRSSRSRRRATMDNSTESLIVVGEYMKKRLLDEGVVGMIVDLFFQYPWNNFLHSAVYDFLHQVLTGRVDSGYNRELVISLFRDAKILHRIIEGQARNDAESSKPKGVRLGYMGHLMLISEDVITALARFPPDLRLIIIQYAPEPEWDQYVTGRYNETKEEDARLLGGGKPVVVGKGARGGSVMQWKVDEDDLGVGGSGGGIGGGGNGNGGGGGGVRGEFRRASSVEPSSGQVTSTADFGPAPMEEDEDEDDDNVLSGRAPHFARYLAQEISSDHFGSSSSDDDDEDEGWLAQSTFNSIGSAPVSTRTFGEQRRPLSSVGTFDDSFDPTGSVSLAMSQDPFSPHDDDGFGPFSDPSGGTVSDSFTFSSSLSDEDSSFENFGDFGDFQTAEDGELTPTSGSWTFANEGGGSVDSSGTGAGAGGAGTGSEADDGSSSSSRLTR
ncbi:SAPS-domain-containing protein [Phlegmacium glaucopus]|nr:SAPS-domain-containing protein [Phlegmacium glaucopus]